MADALKNILLLVLSEQCFDEYFINFNFLDVPCFKSSISKVLGLSIIAGSIMVKVPQILKILQNKSGAGISIFGVCLELFAMTATVAYSYVRGFPFSSWGDGIFLGIQTAAIAALVIFFGGNQGKAASFIIAYTSILAVLMSGLTPVGVLWFLQACNIPIVFVGKMIQVHTNYKNGSTGQLSAITCFMLCFGSTARIFTSIQETGDTIIIATFCIASFANALIVAQLLYYWNTKPTAERVKKD